MTGDSKHGVDTPCGSDATVKADASDTSSYARLNGVTTDEGNPSEKDRLDTSFCGAGDLNVCSSESDRSVVPMDSEEQPLFARQFRAPETAMSTQARTHDEGAQSTEQTIYRYLLARVEDEDVTFAKSNRVADEIGATTLRAGQALRKLADREHEINLTLWSSPSNTPKTWRVTRAEGGDGQ